MKPLAIVLLILGCVLVAIFGFAAFVVLIMSFGSSAHTAQNGGSGLLILLPVMLLALALLLAFTAFMAGNYRRSARIGSVFAITLVGAILFLTLEGLKSARYVQKMQEQEREDAQYPVQKFIRPTEWGADTLIVFPSRVVAYRMFDPNKSFPLSGPLGTLAKTRDTIQLDRFREDHLKREEWEGFVNSAGEKFTEVFQFKE